MPKRVRVPVETAGQPIPDERSGAAARLLIAMSPASRGLDLGSTERGAKGELAGVARDHFDAMLARFDMSIADRAKQP